jgi:hypothetical protein
MTLVPTLFDFEPGTPAYSAQVDSNFAAIRDVVNGGLDQTNLASGAVTAAKTAVLPRVKAAVALPYNQLASQGGQVTLGTAEYDTDNLYDDVNDYFTVITAGVYMVTGYVEHLAAGAADLHVRRAPGGTGPANFGGTSVIGSAGSGALTVTSQSYFSAGDRIDMAWTNFAGAQNGLASGFLAATWLSP